MLRDLLRLSVAPFALTLLGCTSEDNGTIQLITDVEAGTFTQKPAVTKLEIVAVEAPDASAVLATATLPTSTIDLGKLSEDAPAVSINVKGFDSTGTEQVFGASIPLTYAQLDGVTLPLFVQRTGELARLPGPLGDSRQGPVLAVIPSRYLVIAGGSPSSLAESTQLFDFLAFVPTGPAPSLPVAPQSLAIVGTIGWLIGGTSGYYFDFSGEFEMSTITLPANGGFADVAGGSTVIDPNGAEYIVGATRLTGQPTKLVLKIDPSSTSASYPFGNMTWLSLTTARLGAAATWVPGTGLVVIGGSSATGAAGVEVVGDSASTGSGLPYPADPTTGAGAAPLPSGNVLVGGGVGSTASATLREIDMTCTQSFKASCISSWGTLPLALASAQTFTWASPTNAFVVGNEKTTGKTHAFRITKGQGITEIPLRVAHTNARAVWSPVGSVVVFGGADVIESFTPGP